MDRFLGTALGKSVRLASLLRKSGGQALPGLVVEQVFPNYISNMLKKLPEGVVIITGTNGKTTTTKIVADLLQANGKRVLTNSTGSNLTRGIVSGLTKQAKITGKLPFDLAVLEVDEASAKRLINKIKPTWVLALNVSRDQLDRFGEVNSVAELVGTTMRSATKGVITNANDPLLTKIGKDIASSKKMPVKYFGVVKDLSKFFPSDYDLASVGSKLRTDSALESSEVELSAFADQKVTYKIDGQTHTVSLSLKGQHNFQNAAAALALARQLLPNVAVSDLINPLAGISIAFGRGEQYHLANSCNVELALVKNPAGFRQALMSYAGKDHQIMIAINDKLADGRDVSWLWDVDFSPLAGKQVSITSGTRAADMALRLSYDDISVGDIEPKLDKALSKLVGNSGSKTIFATYTAMTHLHTKLTKLASEAK